MSRRPNILFVNTDQHSWHALSAYGNPHVRTPNIDRLHANGVSFMRAYCTDPVCAAARSSWASGRYASETGVPFNGGHMHDDIPDIGQVLGSEGYDACHCGKWHVDGRSVAGSFRNLYFGRRHIGAGGAEFHDPASTHAALDFLARRAAGGREGDGPFYLQLGYVNPHDVCEYLHNHEQKRVPGPLEQGDVPVVSEDTLPPLPDNFDYDERETVLQRVARRADDAFIHAPILRAVRRWTPLQWRYYIWNYYRFVEKADREIGLVLDLVELTDLRHDTLVIFSSDHGEACASHRMFQKFTLYEESVRVPFIVACLGDGLDVPRGRFDREHFVSGVDLFPTICDYAGVDMPADVRGRSVRPLVEGADVQWPDHAYIESNYWGRAVVSTRYKLVTEYRPKAAEDFVPPGPDAEALGVEQLFDLEEDPGETSNLASEPRHARTLRELREQLFAHEAGLRRRPLAEGGPRRAVSRWAEKLLQAGYPGRAQTTA